MKSLLRILTGSFLVLVCIATAALAQDDEKKPRKKSPELLPDSTVMYFQINDINALKQKLTDSAFGEMLKDETMRPFVESMYGEAQRAYNTVKDQVAGVELEQLFELPQGEICFALIAFEREDPAPIFVMDIDPDSETAQKLIDRGRELAENDGASLDSEDKDGIEIHHLNDNDDEGVYYFQHEGTYVFTSNRDVIDYVLAQWLETDVEELQPTLAKNRKFITIMNKCRGTKKSPPEFSFFIDPIEMFKASTRGNPGARLALAFLPTLGLDGLLGVGGSAIYNQDGYDSILHAHILLSSPRNGVFELIALKPGMNDPEPFVPANVISYVTANINAKKLLSELTGLVDAFQEEGAFEAMIDENINQELDIDFEEDLIGSLDGRLTWITWPEPPARINSQANLLAVKLSNVDKFEEVMTKILDRMGEDNQDFIKEKRFSGESYWAEPDGAAEERAQRRQDRIRELREESGVEAGDDLNVETRSSSPCFMILNDYFILTESEKFLKEVIKTYKGDNDRLADDEQYATVIKEMEKQLGTQLPSLTMFNRPAESMRFMFELAKSDNTKSALDFGADQNDYLKGIRNAFEDGPLPDFADVKRFFPPAGGFVTSDETGFHIMLFGLKPEKADK